MAKKKIKTFMPTLDRNLLTERILNFLMEHRGESFPKKKIMRLLKITNHPGKMMAVDILENLIEEKKLSQNSDGDIAYNPQSQIEEGTYVRRNHGKGYVETADGTLVRIYDEDAHHAIHGDKVKVCIFAKRRGGTKVLGEVTEIISHDTKPIVGTIQMHGDVAFLVTYSGLFPYDILIPKDKQKGCKNGDKVTVRILSWPDDTRNPVGEVIDVLGKSGDNNTEMHAILAEYGLPYSYPEAVEKEADKLNADITPEEIAKREDFRNVTTFTIDPKDAKDFDDALSIRRLDNGLWEVGVHIADVSHYVKPNSIIDQEAYNRATSIYLVDRTIPMLPERLCNFICSLRPDEEKLTFSVVFDMDEEANIKNSRIVHTVIKSCRRFAYEEVQEILEQNGEASDIPDAVPVAKDKRKGELAEELITLNRMAHRLREGRFKTGAIDFNSEEAKFDIDENGKPLRVWFKKSKDANKLIEEFMLLANRTVAESVGKSQDPKTLPYRIHDVPDPTKLETLGNFVSRFGMKLNTQGSSKDIAQSLNKLFIDVNGKSMEKLVETVALRAMAKARYSTFNIGHYGLAFDYYTHFTSPIRRYPDLMVHRLLTAYEQGAKSANKQKYEEYCDHSSEMEQLAANAERASIKYKQVEFLADKIGQEFDATITGVTEFGVYAEINENHCEGLVSLRYLGDETFDYDDRSYCLVGRKTGNKFTIGDEVRIKVAAANLFKKQLDFELVDPENTHRHAADVPFYKGLKSGGQTATKGKKSKGKKNKRK